MADNNCKFLRKIDSSMDIPSPQADSLWLAPWLGKKVQGFGVKAQAGEAAQL
jgi:hypothetical protein